MPDTSDIQPLSNRPSPVDRPSAVDTERPSPSRVYDYFLGGSHNFEVDRVMAARLAATLPEVGAIMRANRAFLHRAVRFLVAAGVRQFLDLGSGIPTVGNVHEIAQRADPAARVVYVDHDPVAVAHSREMLAGNDRATIVEADFRDPAAVFGAPAAALLDPTEPIALLLVGVLHEVSEADRPGEMIAAYRAGLAPGSYLALSAASSDDLPEAEDFKREFDQGYERSAARAFTLRTRAVTLALFDGFELVEPGLVDLPEWRPDGSGPRLGDDPTRTTSTWAGVGRLAAEFA